MQQLTTVKVPNKQTAKLLAHAAGTRALEGFIEHVLDRLDALEHGVAALWRKV
jgi:hypothetical protein